MYIVYLFSTVFIYNNITSLILHKKNIYTINNNEGEL